MDVLNKINQVYVGDLDQQIRKYEESICKINESICIINEDGFPFFYHLPMYQSTIVAYNLILKQL